MSQAPNRYGGFSKCQAGTPTQKQKFNEQPLGALSLLRTVVPESLRHAGPKGLARARLLESVVGRAEQGEGLAMGWSRGERTVDSGLPRVHRGNLFSFSRKADPTHL